MIWWFLVQISMGVRSVVYGGFEAVLVGLKWFMGGFTSGGEVKDEDSSSS